MGLKGSMGNEKKMEHQHPLFSGCRRRPPKPRHHYSGHYRAMWSKIMKECGRSRTAPLDFSHLSLQPALVQTVVVHSPCYDGLASAIAAYMFNPNIEFFLVNHQELARLGPLLHEKRVLFLDICPNPESISSWGMADFAVIDHHVSAERSMVSLEVEHKYFNHDRSACALAWAYFFPQHNVPGLFLAVEARDLWKQETIENCQVILAGLRHLAGNCLGCWLEYMVSEHRRELLMAGRILEESREDRVGSYVVKAQRRRLLGLTAWVVNCTDRSCYSDVGAELVKIQGREADISMTMTYNPSGHEWWCSLRSKDGVGPDVSAMCAHLGGGGHRHAAGFVWNSPDIEKLFGNYP